MSVRIVTDSASDLTQEEVSSLGITIVPLSIRFGEEELVDEGDLGFHFAAEQKHAGAQYSLAWRYLKGEGTAKNASSHLNHRI